MAYRRMLYMKEEVDSIESNFDISAWNNGDRNLRADNPTFVFPSKASVIILLKVFSFTKYIS